MKYLIYKSFASASQPTKVFDTEDQVHNFIADQANELNYGMYRWWTIDGIDFYDVGPCIYAVHTVA